MRVAISLRSARVISLSLSECVLYPAADRALPTLRRGVERACKRQLASTYAIIFQTLFDLKRCSIQDRQFLRVFAVSFQRNDRAITRYATMNYHELPADSRLSTNTGFDQL